MGVLFHFGFVLLKISILGCLYGTFPLLIFIIIRLFKPKLLGHISRIKFKIWFYSGLIISFALLIFMFTYWGNHGLGDTSTIPIGHSKVINYGVAPYIDRSDVQIHFKNFSYDTDKIYASSPELTDGRSFDFMIYDIEKDEVKFYITQEDYLIEAKKYNYPTPDKFEDFMTHYGKYWWGWRLILLP